MKPESSLEKQIEVVVPLYNEERNIRNLCEALQHQKSRPFDVLIIDNGSSDSSVKIASEYFPVYSCTFPGSYVARNYGIAQGQAPYVFLLDGDCIPDENWVEMLATELDSGMDAVSGRIKARPYGSLAKHLLGRELAIYWVEYYGGPSVTSNQFGIDCSFPTPNVAYRRVLFDHLGPFSVNLGADVEFSSKVARNGYKCKVCNKTAVSHLVDFGFLAMARKFILYSSQRKLAWPQFLAALLLLIFLPLVFMVHFLTTFVRRSSRARAFGIRPSSFALFEALRLVCTLIGILRGHLFPPKEVERE